MLDSHTTVLREFLTTLYVVQFTNKLSYRSINRWSIYVNTQPRTGSNLLRYPRGRLSTVSPRCEHYRSKVFNYPKNDLNLDTMLVVLSSASPLPGVEKDDGAVKDVGPFK